MEIIKKDKLQALIAFFMIVLGIMEIQIGLGLNNLTSLTTIITLLGGVLYIVAGLLTIRFTKKSLIQAAIILLVVLIIAIYLYGISFALAFPLLAAFSNYGKTMDIKRLNK